MPAARTPDDVASILSQIAILRTNTIATLIVDETGRLTVWGGDAPARAEPLYSWNITSFFELDEAEEEEEEGLGGAGVEDKGGEASSSNHLVPKAEV